MGNTILFLLCLHVQNKTFHELSYVLYLASVLEEFQPSVQPFTCNFNIIQDEIHCKCLINLKHHSLI